MIISNNKIQSLLKTYGKDLNSNVNSVKDIKTKTAAYDELAISGESRIKQRAFQVARQAEDIRHDKVNALAEEISTGTYTRSDEEVAEKMIALAIVDKMV
ncbi:MAG: flagellar biosynthesis anti-sigma factor FlgM [Syntrophomonas sp.]|nr:flagellar biosynthesis anti-sigma factor FlgM [Syntrophomonas sp.]